MECLDVEKPNKFLKNACRASIEFNCSRYLLAISRNDGAAKAIQHKNLVEFYVALATGCSIDNAQIFAFPLYRHIHYTTQELTNDLDVKIGFKRDQYIDEVMILKFFDSFHNIAMKSILTFNKK